MTKKSTIIVTGGAGFIGYEVAKKYIQLGHRVYVLDNLSNLTEKNAKDFSQVKFIHCDLREKAKLIKLINSIRPTVINHHAGHIDVTHSLQSPSFDAENNILVTLNLLETLNQISLQKFIFASSGGAVYKPNAKLPFTEKTELAPANPYGIAKLASEHYVRLFGKLNAFQTVILRYANVYGATQYYNSYQGVIVKLATQLLNDQPLTINGQGKQTRDFIYIDDVVSANVLALEYSNLSEIFNIGSGKKLSIQQVVQEIAAAIKKKPQMLFTNQNQGEN